ncbi:MAG: GntP family permease [Actinomycetales bacterium]
MTIVAREVPMLGLIGIILSLGLLMFLAYRGINVLVLAPLLALLATLFAAQPLLATYTQVFMPALGKYAMTYFPLFLLGAIFGKLMDDAGAARAIAHSIADRLGSGRAVLAIVLSCALLTYGGVSLFVVAFAVFPIAAALFREAAVPRRFIPAAIALGSFTFTMTALPGTPAIQNAIPSPYFGTNAFAAPGLGIIGGLVMFGGGMAWLTVRTRRAMAAGEGYDDGPLMRAGGAPVAGPDVSGSGGTAGGGGGAAKSNERAGSRGTGSGGTGSRGTGPFERDAEAAPAGDQHAGTLTEAPPQADDRPSMALAMIPIVVVIAANYALVNWIFPAMDFDYLGQDAYGNTDIATVGGIWAIIVALVLACGCILVLFWRRIADAKQSLNAGTMGSLLPIFNTASEVGYGAVIASLPAFTIVKNAVLGITGNPVLNLAVAVNVLAGITGSASGGMSIALQTLGETFRQQAEAQGISLELMHRVTAMASGGFDSLPHNGAVITLLAICGLSHRQSYKDIGVVSVVIPVIATIVVVILGSIFGGF